MRKELLALLAIALVAAYLIFVPMVPKANGAGVAMTVVIVDTSGVSHKYAAPSPSVPLSITVNGYTVSSISFYATATPTYTGSVSSASFTGSYTVSDTDSSVSLSGGSISSTSVTLGSSGTSFYVPNPADGAVPVYSVSASALSYGSSGTYTLTVSLSVTLTAQIVGNPSASTVTGSASGSVTYSYSAGTLSALTVSVT
jgi:hypothetical protein